MKARPPRIATAVLRALIPRERRDEVLGDLEETWARLRGRSPLHAGVWYVAQSVAVPAWMILDRFASIRWGAGDLRRSIRTLARSPRLTVAAVVSLALGIGATTTIAGAVDAILLEPLPVDRPEELSLVYHTWPDRWEGGQYGSSQTEDPTDGLTLTSNVSFPAFQRLQAVATERVDLAGFAFVREMAVVTADRPALAAGGMAVSGNYFATLRLRPALGRILTADDDRAGAPRVAVLSHAFWSRAFAGDGAIVGRSIDLNGEPFEIVGVAQREYQGLSPGGFFGPSGIMVPLASAEAVLPIGTPDGPSLADAHDIHWVRLIARVSDGVPVAPLQDALGDELRATLAADGTVAAGDAGEVQVRFLDGRRGLDSLQRRAEGPLRILGAVVALVLLIACGNLATLLLARGATRRGELAVRRAMGAGRWDLARPLLTESLLLAGAGAGLGVVLAVRAGPAVTAVLTGGSASSVAFDVDGRLLGAAALAALVAAMVSSLPPALRAMRVDPGGEFGARSEGGGSFPALGRGLIVAQIALSMPLVVGAGLFLRTLGNLADVDPGFDPNGLVVFRVDPSFVTRDADQQDRIYGRVLDGLRATPGLEVSSAVENALLSGWQSDTNVEIDGERHHLAMNAVAPGLFETLGIPVLAGRDLTVADGPGAPGVALVNETAARELFAGSAVGRRFRVGERDVEVVGVVGDTRYSSLKTEVEPTFHDPWTQRPDGVFALHFVVRSDRPVGELESTIRDVVADVDPGMPVTAFRSQGDDIARGSARERLFAQLLGAFGVFALVLAGIGLHGVTAFAVARRTGEIGVRLALGAAPARIVGMVLRQVAGLAVAGLVVGVGAALALAPVVRSMLFGVAPADPITLLVAGTVMVASTVVAAWWPARRAARLDPRSALSTETG